MFTRFASNMKKYLIRKKVHEIVTSIVKNYPSNRVIVLDEDNYVILHDTVDFEIYTKIHKTLNAFLKTLKVKKYSSDWRKTHHFATNLYLSTIESSLKKNKC